MTLYSQTIRTVTAPGASGNTITQGPGTVRYVNSNGGGSTTSGGLTRESAFTTIDSAINASSAGDTIIVMEGHAETQAASGDLFTADVAGIKIVGEGIGSRRPTLTFSHTGATTTLSAANLLVKNVLFLAGVDSITTFGTISGADCTFEDVESRDVTDVEVVDDFIVTGARFTARRHFKNGYTGGNANARVFKLNGVARALFEDCRFVTKVTTAVINFVTAASTDVMVKNCVFEVNGTTDYSKTVVDTITGSTWSVSDNCFDLGAGSHFTGGSGAALAGVDVSAVSAAVTTIDGYHDVPTADSTDNAQMRDVIGNKTDAVLTAVAATKSVLAYAKTAVKGLGFIADAAVYAVSATDSAIAYLKGLLNSSAKVTVSSAAVMVDNNTLFTITGGPIRIIALWSECVTGNDGTASTVAYKCTPTAGAEQTISAASASIANAAAGASITLAGTALSTAALYNANGPNLIANPGTIIAPAGTIDIDVGVGPTTGTWRHYMRWEPMKNGVTVA